MLLVLLAAAIHTWLLCHTPVIARDGVGFIRYSLQLERHPWIDAMRRAEHPPLYPLCVLAASVPVRSLCGGITCDSMMLSAQLISVLAGVLLVFPMYALGRTLFDRRVAFWATALFQCLPIAAHVTSDALSDGLYLFWAATTLALGAGALRGSSMPRFALCGLCGGLAYLTRPEGILPVVALGLILLGMQLETGRRRSWGALASSLSGLALGASALMVPYVAVSGHLTNKPAARRVLGTAQAEELAPRPGEPAPTAGRRPSLNPPLQASLLAAWWTAPRDGSRPTLAWTVQAVGKETIRAFHFVGWLPALLGLVWFRDRFRSDPGARLLLVLCTLHAAVLIRMGQLVNYVAERHTLILVLCGSYWAMAAIVAIGERLSLWLSGRGMPGRRYLIPEMVALALTVVGLPVTLQPLHAVQAGYRAVGQWLAQHARPGDVVVDPRSWAYYYGGRVFQEERPPAPTPTEPPAYFVVVDGEEEVHAPEFTLPAVQDMIRQGTVVFRSTWGGNHQKHKEVLIYTNRPSRGGTSDPPLSGNGPPEQARS